MAKLLLYLNLIRWNNILLLLFCQILFKYQVFPYFKSTSLLSNFEFILLLISVICIAAGGYIINDIFDVKCDKINKPKKVYIPKLINLKTAKLYYVSTTGLGLLFGSTVCILTGNAIHIITYLIVIILLYTYSLSFKRTALIGNFITAALVSFNLILLLLLDSNFNQSNKAVHLTLLFSLFSFLINFLREIIKDIEDVNGDYNSGFKTLPIIIGNNRTVKFVLGFSIIPLYFLLNFGIYELNKRYVIQIFYWLFIVSTFFLFIYKTCSAISKPHFSFISKLLKWILIFGLILIFLMTYA
ncbi:geranylgeranylglycerol-phosphate geranylgeranyltransferase [Flavicella sp.]|uniref:geranylgeranylglycerol-phosphate geranylgeranyltransferase n=1 Tax=Flavicella sp. TaxID=2957742 RepID=UPI003015C19F